MDSNRISYLFNQLESNSLTITEREELYSLLRSFENNDEILAWLEDSYKNTTPQPINTEHWRPIFEYIIQQPGVLVERPQADAKIVPLKPIRRPWIKWVAAACIIALLGIAAYIILRGVEGRHKEPQTATTHDLAAPKETRAVITLSNRQKVYLDSVENGTIATETGVKVVKTEDGRIIYSHQDAKAKSEIAYNTLSNPRGSKVISLTLADGTRVWLNSESSLKYPTAFTANTREVEITGEAYFEVKHNVNQPFKVHLPNGSIVEDIGTSFNINSYSDEDNIRTTLIEGSVRFTPLSPAGGGDLGKTPDRKRPGVDRGVILKPGEQAVATGNSLLTTRSVDVDEVTAWKNGRFQFSDASIENIMKEVSRYYDAQVVYQENIPGHFVADISRDVPVSKLLQILELTNRVHFKIEGRKITVSK